MREAMRNRRRELGKTMKKAAAEAKITPGYWSVIESQNEKPTLDVAGRMAAVLEMKPEEAFTELAPLEVAKREPTAS